MSFIIFCVIVGIVMMGCLNQSDLDKIVTFFSTIFFIVFYGGLFLCLIVFH
jgi:succinate dehydrogenase hydrophobic anchor subunit